MIALTPFLSLLLNAALASVVLHILARLAAVERSIRAPVNDWSDEETDRIERSAKVAS